MCEPPAHPLCLVHHAEERAASHHAEELAASHHAEELAASHSICCNIAPCYNACRYPDYVLTDSGLQYKDLRDGSGDTASNGSRVTIDWDGYTLGYYGRPFEARNKVPSDKTFCCPCSQTHTHSAAEDHLQTSRQQGCQCLRHMLCWFGVCKHPASVC